MTTMTDNLESTIVDSPRPKMPTCPGCGRKFPGDPCCGCGMSVAAVKDEIARANAARSAAEAAWALGKPARMPSATRRRRKHGRPV